MLKRVLFKDYSVNQVILSSKKVVAVAIYTLDSIDSNPFVEHHAGNSPKGRAKRWFSTLSQLTNPL